MHECTGDSLTAVLTLISGEFTTNGIFVWPGKF